MNDLSVRDCIRFGWVTFKKRPWLIIGAVLIMGIFSLSFSSETDSFDEFVAMIPYFLTFGLALGALKMAVELLFTRFFLKAHDSVETLAYKDTFPARPFWKYVGGKVAVGIVVMIGFFLLIIPGIIAALMFIFTSFLIVEKKLWPIEAMKESARMTKGYRWQLFLLSLALIGLNILGLLAVFAGLLVSVPVSMLALVHAYRTLEAKAKPVSA